MGNAIETSSLDLLGVTATTTSKHIASATEEYVASLSLSLFEHVSNNREFDSPLVRHILPDFKADHEFVCATDQQGLMENIRIFTEVYPDHHAEVLNVSVKADERLGKAKVWLLQLIHGLPGGTRRESVSVL